MQSAGTARPSHSKGGPRLQDTLIADADRLASAVSHARTEIGRVIFGQADVVEQTLIALLAGGHALLVGVPGLGKTLLVETLGTVLGLDRRRVQFTPMRPATAPSASSPALSSASC